ncbi:MAG TPA: DUF3828 domain-containing protein [Pyrinomonadaceae bacterium]|nr:DUF3828 domain-containing protein [Pyrinomonadaceae bacterium]
MNIRSHRICLTAALLVTCLASLTVPARGSRVRKSSPDAARVVQSFFDYHFAHDKNFTGANIKRRRRWLTPELYTLLLREYHREEVESAKHPDEVVFMEGDPFTNTQEFPDSFSVGRAVVNGNKATVPVIFSWRSGAASKVADIKMRKLGGLWLIQNIRPDDDESLLKLLRRRLRNSATN